VCRRLKQSVGSPANGADVAMGVQHDEGVVIRLKAKANGGPLPQVPVIRNVETAISRYLLDVFGSSVGRGLFGPSS